MQEESHPENMAAAPQEETAQRANREPAAQPAPEPQDPRARFQNAVAAKQQVGDDPEDDLWSGSYSYLAMIGTWVIAGVLSLVAIIGGPFFSLPILPTLGIVLLVWIVLAGLYGYRRYSVHYALTSQRIIHAAGLLWRTNDRVELIDVDDVTFRQGPVERMLGVGTIIIASSDRTTPELILPGIENAREVADMIDDARRKERRSRGLHIESV